MRKELGKNKRPSDPNCKCNFGIATGVVFAGVLGSSGTRKEYSVFGDHVNLAAWLMGSGNGWGSLLIDKNTKIAAEKSIPLKYNRHKQFKGKSLKLPIYELSMNKLNECFKAAIEELDFVGKHGYSGVH